MCFGCMCVHVCVCFVCMWVHVCVLVFCAHVGTCMCMYVCVRVCMFVCDYVFVCEGVTSVLGHKSPLVRMSPCMLFGHKGHNNTIQVYSVTVMTYAIALEAGVIGSDVPGLDCPACSDLTWVITVTE